MEGKGGESQILGDRGVVSDFHVCNHYARVTQLTKEVTFHL